MCPRDAGVGRAGTVARPAEAGPDSGAPLCGMLCAAEPQLVMENVPFAPSASLQRRQGLLAQLRPPLRVLSCRFGVPVPNGQGCAKALLCPEQASPPEEPCAARPAPPWALVLRSVDTHWTSDPGLGIFSETMT